MNILISQNEAEPSWIVIILLLVTNNNRIICFLCYYGWHKSLLTNVCHGKRKEPLCQYLVIYIRISFKLDFHRTWWRLLRKRIVCTKFAIWVIIRNWQVLIVRKLENKVVLNKYFNIAKWRRSNEQMLAQLCVIKKKGLFCCCLV
jgi:hypothetical protein